MDAISEWSERFHAAISHLAHDGDQLKTLRKVSQPLLAELIAAQRRGHPIDGILYALVVIIEQHVSLAEDDPALIEPIQQVFYSLPDYAPEINPFFLHLEIYPLLGMTSIYE